MRPVHSCPGVPRSCEQQQHSLGLSEPHRACEKLPEPHCPPQTAGPHTVSPAARRCLGLAAVHAQTAVPKGAGPRVCLGEASRYGAARSLNKQKGPPRAPGVASPGNEVLRAAVREAGPPPRLPREVPGLPWGKHNITRGPAGPDFLIHSLGGGRYSLLAQAYLSVGLSLASGSILLRIFPDVLCLLPLLMGPLVHCESCLHTDLIIPFS